jgi:hypothetical protein
MRRKKGEEGLIGLGIRAEGEKAGLARLEMGSLGGNGKFKRTWTIDLTLLKSH